MRNYVLTSAENGPAMAGPDGPVPAPMVIHAVVYICHTILICTLHCTLKPNDVSSTPCEKFPADNSNDLSISTNNGQLTLQTKDGPLTCPLSCHVMITLTMSS